MLDHPTLRRWLRELSTRSSHAEFVEPLCGVEFGAQFAHVALKPGNLAITVAQLRAHRLGQRLRSTRCEAGARFCGVTPSSSQISSTIQSVSVLISRPPAFAPSTEVARFGLQVR